MPGDIVLLHMCTINEDHTKYGSWNKRCNRPDVLSFGPFLPIYWQLSDVFDIVMFQNSEEKLWIPITELAILIADNTATSRSKSEIPLSDKQIKFLKWMLPVYMQVITILYICHTYSIWYSFSDVEQVLTIHWEFWSRKSGNTCISNFLK